MKAFKDLVEWAQREGMNTDMLTHFITMVLLPHVRNLDTDKILSLLTILPVMRKRMSIRGDIITFGRRHRSIINMFNGVDREDLSTLWAEYQLNPTSPEVRFVKGCEDLAGLFMDINSKTAAGMLQRLTDFCRDTDILNDIFEREEING